MYCTCGRIDNKADLTWLDFLVVAKVVLDIASLLLCDFYGIFRMYR